MTYGVTGEGSDVLEIVDNELDCVRLPGAATLAENKETVSEAICSARNCLAVRSSPRAAESPVSVSSSQSQFQAFVSPP